MFLLLTSLLSTVIDMPSKVYLTFVLEQRHGFNKQVVHRAGQMSVCLTSSTVGTLLHMGPVQAVPCVVHHQRSRDAAVG